MYTLRAYYNKQKKNIRNSLQRCFYSHTHKVLQNNNEETKYDRFQTEEVWFVFGEICLHILIMLDISYLQKVYDL